MSDALKVNDAPEPAKIKPASETTLATAAAFMGAGPRLGGLGARPADQLVDPAEFGFETHARPHLRLFVPSRIVSIEYRRHLAIPLIGRHECLEPWFRDGDVCWYQEDVQPSDGDLVACEILYRRRSRDDGKVMRLTSVKQYRVVKGIPMLCCRQGAIPVSQATVLGAIVAWRRPGWWKRPSVKRMQFGPDVRCHT